MRKLVCLAAIFALLFVSCSTETDIEQEARNRLQLLMDNPSYPDWDAMDFSLLHAQTSKPKLGMKNKNICTLLFDVTTTDESGKTKTFPVEYTYINVIRGYGAFDTPASKHQQHAEVFSPLIPTEEVRITPPLASRAQFLKTIGADMKYIKSHTVEDVAKKYRNKIIRTGRIDPKDPELDFCIIYHSAMGKTECGGHIYELPEENTGIKNFFSK